MPIKNQHTNISIIIPAYNEEKRLGKTLNNYLAYFNSKYGSNYEILVVLNGCKDTTEQVAKQYASSNPCLKYFNFPDPIGKGGAIAEGYKVATGDLVAYTDADGSAGPEMIEKLFKILVKDKSIDCAIGSRNLSQSETKGRTFFRKILTKGFNTSVNLLFGLKVKDTQCGAKVVRREILTQILPYLTISNLSFDVNLLFEIKRAGGKIVEIPIVWTDDHDSTIKKPIKTSIIMFLSILRLRLIYSPFKQFYPLIRPFSELVWKILLTDKEMEYRTIKHN